MQLDFIKYKYFYFLISVLLIIPSIISLALWGLKPAIDFTGGSVLEIKIKERRGKTPGLGDLAGIEKKVEGVGEIIVQEIKEDTYLLKMKEINKDKKEEILEKLKEKFGEIEEIRFETVGPIIGQELIKKTVLAVILASAFIVVYVSFRFKDKKYGFCAILAMLHDTIILLGTFSLLGHFLDVEVDTLFVTAVLTILSFSVHDTVVVYDKIRESLRRYPRAEFRDLASKAIAETLTRSINNSMTIIFMLLCLYLLGGETIRWFTFALLVGTIAGTYSSTFTAVPLLVVWQEKEKQGKNRDRG